MSVKPVQAVLHCSEQADGDSEGINQPEALADQLLVN